MVWLYVNLHSTGHEFRQYREFTTRVIAQAHLSTSPALTIYSRVAMVEDGQVSCVYSKVLFHDGSVFWVTNPLALRHLHLCWNVCTRRKNPLSGCGEGLPLGGKMAADYRQIGCKLKIG